MDATQWVRASPFISFHFFFLVINRAHHATTIAVAFRFSFFLSCDMRWCRIPSTYPQFHILHVCWFFGSLLRLACWGWQKKNNRSTHDTFNGTRKNGATKKSTHEIVTRYTWVCPFRLNFQFFIYLHFWCVASKYFSIFNFLILNDVHSFFLVHICCSSMRTTGIICTSQSEFERKKKLIIVCNLFCLRWSKCRRSSQARENNNKNKIFSPSRRIWKIEEEEKMNQRTKAGKLYFIIDLACLLKRPLSPSVRSFTHSKSPSSPIAPFLLQPLFIHFSLCFACIHLYLRRSLRIEYRVKRKSWADTFFFCVKSFCRRRCCWCSHKWECCLPLKHKINIRRFMLLTVWRLTQDDKIEKLAFNWVKKRMWVLSSPTMKTTTNAQTAYPGPNTCGKIAQLNGLNPNTYFVYLC